MKKLEIYVYLTTALLFAAIALFGGNSNLPENTNFVKGWLPIVALGASVLGTALQSASQRRQARELEQANQRPLFRPSAQLQENRQLALEQRQVGLPDQVYNNQLNQIQQGLSTGLRTIGTQGSISTNTNSLLNTLNRSLANLNAQDALARQQGTQALMSANQALANEQRYAYQQDLNEYNQNRATVASTRRASTQNLFGALGLLGQGAMSGVFGGMGSTGGLGTTGGSSGFMNAPLWGSSRGMFG